MSIMVAEPDSIPSEKRMSLLHKEQITDKNSMIQMNLDTYESTITMKQNHDIPISEMMKQMVEVTKTISQRRLQQCTQEQTSDSNALSRDRPQRLHEVIVETVQDSTNETRITGTGTNEDQMMTERVTVDKGELSSERECDVSVLIKQIYTGSDSMSQCVLCFSGLQRMLERCTGLSGALQNVTGALPEKGMSDSDLQESQRNETVDMMKQLIEKSRVELETLERLEDEPFKGKDAQFVKMKGLITQLIVRLKTEVNCISEYNEEMLENDNMSSSTMFTSPGEIDEAGFVDIMSTLNESKNTEMDRAKLRDTLEGMHDRKGINIHEDTSEERETDTIKGPNNVDSKRLNCQNCEERTYINKQSPNLTEDATDGVYANKDDLVVQVPQMQGVRQYAGMLQADGKQPDTLSIINETAHVPP